MNNRIRASVALGIFLVASNSWPHHNMTAFFDLNDRVTLTGTFTKVAWLISSFSWTPKTTRVR